MKKPLIAVAVACSLLFGSCSFLDNLANNLSSFANLLNCQYSLKSINNVQVAGVNVKNVTSGNITATDVVKLVSAITAKSVPLGLDVNIDVKNPTQTSALLTAMDWALDVAAKEFASGATDKSYSIPASTTTTVPLGVSTDLYSMFSKDGIESLKNFASSFNSEGRSSQLGLRVRPGLTAAGQTIKWSNYIDIIKPAAPNTSSNSTNGSNSSNGTNGTNGSNGSNGSTGSTNFGIKR